MATYRAVRASQYELAMALDGWALVYVPEALKDRALCELAVAQTGWALEYVPEAIVDRALCELAVAQTG